MIRLLRLSAAAFGDAVHAVGQNAVQATFERQRRLLHRLQR